MKKTVSAHVYNTIERYPQILKTPKVEKAMGNLKCWMALRVNRGFDNSSHVLHSSVVDLTDDMVDPMVDLMDHMDGINLLLYRKLSTCESSHKMGRRIGCCWLDC